MELGNFFIPVDSTAFSSNEPGSEVVEMSEEGGVWRSERDMVLADLLSSPFDVPLIENGNVNWLALLNDHDPPISIN